VLQAQVNEDGAFPPREGFQSRARLLRWAIVGGGALAGGAAGVSGLPQPTSAVTSPEQDRHVLNLVLALAYTEAAFYREALERGALKGELEEFAKIVAQHEQSHVDFLKQALGSAADPAPRHDFGDKTGDANAFAAAAVTLEDLAVATYDGQGANLTTAALQAAARIVSVEARHAAWIRSILGRVPAEETTDTGISEAETRAQLRDFGVQEG
jgi:hypothetical protein